MTWHPFRLTYQLLGPLHIGYHKVGNVQRTRYYIPARNLWGSVTERLTRSGFHTRNAAEGDYRRIGEWVQQHLAFSYFFVTDDRDNLLHPRYDEKGLSYGSLLESEFERRFVSAHVTTALDARTRSAHTGSVHEVEFLAAHDEQGRRTEVAGWVLLDDEATTELVEGGWRERLSHLQVGGERRYGYGRLRLATNGWAETRTLLVGYDLKPHLERPQILVDADEPLLAHTLAQNVQARGMIEPLVGRETRGDSDSFGRALTRGRVCWVPGSVLLEEQPMVVESTGVWRRASEA